MGESYKIPKAPDIDFERLRREAMEKEAERRKESNEERDHRLERAELDTLTDKGTQFTIRYNRRTGLLRRRVKPVVKTFTIHEPTAAVLDEISSLALDIELDETGLAAGGLETIAAARRAVNKNAMRQAEIIAWATLGETAYDIMDGHGTIIRRVNRKRIKSLANLIYSTATPTQLSNLANIVTSQSNLGNFINSIRLLSARTTQPRTELVE